MVNRPSVPEIITVNSESLQTQIRDLLPSQNGFGSELQATNVITPIIDLTASASGTGLGTNLQTALAFGSQTAFDIANTSVTLANSPGFYRVNGVSTANCTNAGGINSLQMDDGATTKVVWAHNMDAASLTSELTYTSIQCDLVFWLDTGVTLTAVASTAEAHFMGSIRQIADSAGTVVNPSGYPL